MTQHVSFDSVGSIGSHGDAVVAIAFTTDGRVLATSGQDRTIKVWGLPNSQHLSTPQLAHQPVSLAFSPDGTLLAAGLDDGSVQLWNVGPQLQERAVISPTFTPSAQLISALAFSPDGARLACGTDAGVLLLDAGSGAVLWGDNISDGPIENVAFSPSHSNNGRILAAGGSKQVHLYQHDTGEEFIGPPADDAPVRSIAFQNNYGGLAWGGDSQQVVFVKAYNGSEIKAQFERTAPVIWVGFSPRGRMLAALDRSRRFTVWPAENPNSNLSPFAQGTFPPMHITKIASFECKLAVGEASGRVTLVMLSDPFWQSD